MESNDSPGKPEEKYKEVFMGGVGRGTRGEEEKWNQMTALESQKESLRKCL